MPLIFSDDLLIGPGASLGVEVIAASWFVCALELPVYYLANAPETHDKLFTFGAASAGATF